MERTEARVCLNCRRVMLGTTFAARMDGCPDCGDPSWEYLRACLEEPGFLDYLMERSVPVLQRRERRLLRMLGFGDAA